MSSFFALLGAIFFSVSAAAADYLILVSPQASEMEKNAAQEMKKYAGKLLGREIPIVNHAGAKGKYIRIGSTAEAAAVLQVDFAKFGDSELIIKSVDGDLYLAGGKARGSLYAVYEYLERFCNVRFLSPTEEYIPALKELPEADYRFAPRIKVRQISQRISGEEDQAFAAKRRLNGILNKPVQLSAKWGGQEQILGCHTFLRFCPPKKEALAANPDFYAMIKGRRVHDGQLCLSNERLRQHTVNYIRKWLKDNPTATRVSVSMNDCNRFCECPECRKFLQKHNGITSDILLDFVNDVAGRLESEFPEIEFLTLAYLTARKPPKTIKARKNVGIMYCTIEADASKPLDHKVNQVILEDLAKWRETGAKIYLYTYVINDKYFFQCQPNWEAFDRDMRRMYANGAEWYFAEYHTDKPVFGNFYDLRFYVMSRLLWNPDKSLDELIEEFCIPYYGPAAKDVIKAVKILRQAPAENPQVYVCNFASSVIRSLGKDNFLAARSAMQQARNTAAKAGKEYAFRVEKAAIPFDLTVMHDGFDLLTGERPETLKDFDVDAVLEKDIAFLKSAGYLQYGPEKISTWDEFKKRAVRLAGKNDGTIPEGIAQATVPGMKIWSAAEFHRPLRRGMKFVTDQNAYNARAAQLVADGKHIWRIELENALRGKYRIAVLAKIEYQGTPAKYALRASVLESGFRWREWNTGMRAKSQPGAEGYQLYVLGQYTFHGSYDLFIQPEKDPAIRNLYIDRVILIPVK